MIRQKDVELTPYTRRRSNAFSGTTEFNQRAASAESEQKNADDSNTPPLRRQNGCRNLITKPHRAKPSWRQKFSTCKRPADSEQAIAPTPRC